MSIGDDLRQYDSEDDPRERYRKRKEHLQAVVDAHDAQRPEGKRRGSDWDRAKELFPERSTSEWVAKFDADPGIMWSILGDVAKAFKATEGPRKTGRRPGVSMSMQELQRITSPQYSMDDFSVSLPELIGSRSQRQFASRVPCHHSTLTRLMRGELPLTRAVLESLAKAGRVSPYYFKEYRAMYLSDMVTEVMMARPNMSITAIKGLRARGVQ